jgi:uncharacterized glyoxalase superfamily protein PhnB
MSCDHLPSKNITGQVAINLVYYKQINGGGCILKYPHFSISFGLAGSNEDKLAALALYQKAFGAKKTWESIPPDGTDLHIGMEINGADFMIGPGDESSAGTRIGCQMQFRGESELRRAYEFLIEGAREAGPVEGPFPWAKVCALVVDRFGIQWWLHV